MKYEKWSVYYFHSFRKLIQSHYAESREGRFGSILKMAVVSYNKIGLTDECTIYKLVVVGILSYQI